MTDQKGDILPRPLAAALELLKPLVTAAKKKADQAALERIREVRAAVEAGIPKCCQRLIELAHGMRRHPTASLDELVLIPRALATALRQVARGIDEVRRHGEVVLPKLNDEFRRSSTGTSVLDRESLMHRVREIRQHLVELADWKERLDAVCKELDGLNSEYVRLGKTPVPRDLIVSRYGDVIEKALLPIAGGKAK